MPVYNKLVRDLIPDIIKAQGKSLKTEVLDTETYYKELRKKLLEEQAEYMNSTADGEAVEELADMLEVIYALAAVHGASEAELNDIRMKKAAARGGFKERIFLVEADQ